jgi:hypothetical protein
MQTLASMNDLLEPIVRLLPGFAHYGQLPAAFSAEDILQRLDGWIEPVLKGDKIHVQINGYATVHAHTFDFFRHNNSLWIRMGKAMRHRRTLLIAQSPDSFQPLIFDNSLYGFLRPPPGAMLFT